MKFFSKIRRFLKTRKKLKKINKFVEKGETKKIPLNNNDQIDIKKPERRERYLYDYNNSFKSRYENIDKYRIKISPKREYHFQEEDVFNEITKELENLKSKHKNKNHSF